MRVRHGTEGQGERPWARTMVGVLLAGSVAGRPALAHEHAYIGSTLPGGGGLVLRYDFERRFPLAPLPGSPGTYLGIDPAFNAQITDDPAQGIYRLPDGLRVTVQVTALDPGVTVNVDGTVLKKAGNKTAIGTMPYLHTHPEWILTVAEGVLGEYRVSFKMLARGFADSPVYTGILSNVPPPTTSTTSTSTTSSTVGTTSSTTTTTTSSSSTTSTVVGATTSTTAPGATTTTIAPPTTSSTTPPPTSSTTLTTTTVSTTSTTAPACVPPTCDDGTRCTLDVCESNGVCRHDPLEGQAAVTCHLDDLASGLAELQPGTPAASRTVAHLATTVEKVRRLVEDGMVGGKKGARLFRRARTTLVRFGRALDQGVKRRRIPAEVVDAMQTMAADARLEVVRLASVTP